MKTAIYPGAFDPITFGDLDMSNRSSGLFERSIIGIAWDNAKNPLFTTEERAELIKNEINALD